MLGNGPDGSARAFKQNGTTASILIVDDEANIRFSLRLFLQAKGFDVAVAENGEQALKQIATSRPNLVLLDVAMPNCNGYEACQRIRDDRNLDDVKIIFLSAKCRDMEIEKGLAMGADAYQTKPFGLDELLAKITALLNGRSVSVAGQSRGDPASVREVTAGRYEGGAGHA